MNCTFTTPKSYAFRNDGVVTLFKGNTVTANTYGVFNGQNGSYDGDRESFYQQIGYSSAYTASLTSVTSYEANFAYVRVPSEMTTVEDISITTVGAHPLTNYGHMGTVSGNGRYTDIGCYRI